MNVSNLRQNPSLQTLDSSSFRRGGVEQGGLKGLFGKGGGLQELIKGTQDLLKSLQAVEKLMQGMKTGGMQKAASPSQGCSPSPFSQSSFAPSAGKAPVELNPSASGPSSMGGTGSAGGSSSVGSGAGISGDAKLGGGFPSALGQYKNAIESAAAKTGVPASMLAAQIWQESRGNLGATSTNGGNGLTDTGLMQMNPNTFKELQGKYPELQGKNLADPETNILAGAYYMKDMKEQFGNWDLALRAYNSGPNGVDRSNPNAIPAGTGDATYVQKVKQFAETIASGKGTLPA
ncbi:lytic transglycosylase domain-containing protein [Hyalangium minutum]|uniref:Soluble lytic murein transglycosylase n=1 Tax=Hyalangium minutum TaxID=394096 RepID=A0A085WAK8_9BACT|nr:transglycosylase SLT domain-containing protein [Hyalangium minutum]KFE64721.1 Soluble lytic murein transglycosylase [Hyalangium minutum]